MQTARRKEGFQARDMKSLTELERKRALRSITLVKEKICGRIKGCTVADGRAQRDYVTHDESTSPTISVEAFLISIAIDAKEERDVATADVEGAYLHADMDEIVIMLFEGDMVDYMVQANPEKYGPHIHTTKNGKKLLFVSGRARPDIQVPIAFFTSRVTKADRDDWKKLKHLLEYLGGTIDMPLTLSIDNMNVIKTRCTRVTPRHAQPHRRRHHDGKRRPLFEAVQTETEY